MLKSVMRFTLNNKTATQSNALVFIRFVRVVSGS